jgi:hypothetical protein
MINREAFDSNDANPRAEFAEEQYPRVLASKAPVGPRSASPQTPVQFDQGLITPPPPSRALAAPAAAKPKPASTLERAVNVFRAALPYVQRVLPLLDGNVGTAVSNVLAPRLQPHVPVDLAPIQSSLGELQAQHRELRNQVIEQNETLKKVEDQLQMVREATDRNTLEQEELIGDLKSVGRKVNVFAYLLLVLLLASVGMNVFLVLHFMRIVP